MDPYDAISTQASSDSQSLCPHKVTRTYIYVLLAFHVRYPVLSNRFHGYSGNPWTSKVDAIRVQPLRDTLVTPRDDCRTEAKIDVSAFNDVRVKIIFGGDGMSLLHVLTRAESDATTCCCCHAARVGTYDKREYIYTDGVTHYRQHRSAVRIRVVDTPRPAKARKIGRPRCNSPPRLSRSRSRPR